jgi:hypothetical protein
VKTHNYDAVIEVRQPDAKFLTGFPLKVVASHAPLGLRQDFWRLRPLTNLSEYLADGWRMIGTQRVDGATLYTLVQTFEVDEDKHKHIQDTLETALKERKENDK